MMASKFDILVVDDSTTIRETTERMLVASGYSVKSAAGAREAMSLLDTDQFDLFLLDVVMPDVGGLTMLKELRVFDNTYEVIIMTGHESIDDAASAMELGAFSYIRKPVGLDELVRQVQRAIAMVRMKKSRFDHLQRLEDMVRISTKELEDAVRKLERQGRRMDAIVNSLGEGLLAIDDNYAVVLMNGIAETILGSRFGECAGLHLGRLDARLEVKEYLLSRLESGEADGHENEALCVCVEGCGIRHFSVTVQPITDPTGTRIGTVILFIDQTDATHMDVLRNCFLSVAAHELRTPVNIIMNYLCLLKTRGEDCGTRNVAVEDMRLANNRMKYLVNCIISFVNLSAREIPLLKSEIDVGAIVREEIEKLGAEAREKNIRFDVSSNAESPRLTADPHLLRIAMSNVLSNAVKFNRDNGRVCVVVRNLAAGAGTGTAIDVSDEGEGISALAAKNLFECFSQGEDPMTRRHSGLGTGLFLAKRAVELLGGEIRASSLQGRGSVFSLQFPATPNACQSQGKVLEDYKI